MIQNYGDEMLKIKNNRLYITQGDTLNLKVNLRNNDGSIYEMNDTDIYALTQGQLMNATVSDGEKNIFISNVLGLED